MVWKQAGLALGAGVASALLFVVSAKGTAFAGVIAYFTPLPIVIAALSFGHLSGLGSVIVGAGAVSVATSPVLGAFFILFFALPGWWLSYLAGLARPVEATVGGAPVPFGAPPLAWYPVGRLATWAAVLAAGAVLVAGGIAVLHFGGFTPASDKLAARLGEVLGDEDHPGASTRDIAAFVVRILPVAMAASLCPMLAFNLWLGARIAQTSQRLVRPWPNVPDGLCLPRTAAVVFLVILGPALLPGVIGTVCGVIAAALGVAFAFQGLAAAHVLTRGFSARRAMLGLIYIVTVFIPLAVVALTLIGVVDCLFPLRNRRPPAPKPLDPKGV